MLEPNVGDVVNKALVPNMRRLLQTVKRFPRATNVIKVKGIIESERLVHAYSLN